MMQEDAFTHIAVTEENLDTDVVANALGLIQEWVRIWLYPLQEEAEALIPQAVEQEQPIAQEFVESETAEAVEQEQPMAQEFVESETAEAVEQEQPMAQEFVESETAEAVEQEQPMAQEFVESETAEAVEQEQPIAQEFVESETAEVVEQEQPMAQEFVESETAEAVEQEQPMAQEVQKEELIFDASEVKPAFLSETFDFDTDAPKSDSGNAFETPELSSDAFEEDESWEDEAWDDSNEDWDDAWEEDEEEAKGNGADIKEEKASEVILKEKADDLDPLWTEDVEDNPFTNKYIGIGLGFSSSFEQDETTERKDEGNLAFQALVEKAKETNSVDVVDEDIRSADVVVPKEEDTFENTEDDDEDDWDNDEDDWDDDDIGDAEKNSKKVELSHIYHDMDLEELAFEKAGDLPPEPKDSFAHYLETKEDPVMDSVLNDQNTMDKSSEAQIYFAEVSKNLIMLSSSFDKLRLKVEVLAQKVDTLLAEKDKSENK